MIAVGHLGIQPSEFWCMSPVEFWIVWESRRPRQEDDYQGNLSERDLEELYQMIHEDD